MLVGQAWEESFWTSSSLICHAPLCPAGYFFYNERQVKTVQSHGKRTKWQPVKKVGGCVWMRGQKGRVVGGLVCSCSWQKQVSKSAEGCWCDACVLDASMEHDAVGGVHAYARARKINRPPSGHLRLKYPVWRVKNSFSWTVWPLKAAVYRTGGRPNLFSKRRFSERRSGPNVIARCVAVFWRACWSKMQSAWPPSITFASRLLSCCRISGRPARSAV